MKIHTPPSLLLSPGAPITARADWRPAKGKAGTDLGAMRSQALDPFAIGLAICKMLIAEHQGAIWAQSDRQGTKMSFVLPLHHEMVIGQPVSVSDGAVAVSGY